MSSALQEAIFILKHVSFTFHHYFVTNFQHTNVTTSVWAQHTKKVRGKRTSLDILSSFSSSFSPKGNSTGTACFECSMHCASASMFTVTCVACGTFTHKWFPLIHTKCSQEHWKHKLVLQEQEKYKDFYSIQFLLFSFPVIDSRNTEPSCFVVRWSKATARMWCCLHQW